MIAPIPNISDREFAQFQRFIFDAAGITLSGAKKQLVSGRLARRLQHHGLDSFGHYFALIGSTAQAAERQIAIDLLTTNETYFFREPRHFDFLRQQLAEDGSSTRPLRIWSAACSSGEEPYSIAMVLEDQLAGRRPWSVLASDISRRVLERAATGQYSLERIDNIPRQYLERFCLRGTGPREGTLLVDPELRRKVEFRQINLNRPLPMAGLFDIIFLRNVLIYFNAETKRQVVGRLVSALKPDGWLLVGHSEGLHDCSAGLAMVAPAIYRRAREAA